MAYGSSLAEHLDSAAARKERGAFFTPPQIASFLTSETILSRDDRVLEPSCGEAEFVLAACGRLRALGHESGQFNKQVVACELHEASARAATLRLERAGFSCVCEAGDFLAKEATASFDAVVGNPPYVRFQGVSAKDRLRQRKLAQRMGVDLSALSSMWAPFMLHACEFLLPGGRLGLVLPAELLTVNYAAPIRSFLLKSFARVSLYTFDVNVFPEVQEEVVLLVAKGYRMDPAEHLEWFQCESLRDLGVKASLRFTPKEVGARWSEGLASASSRDVLGSLASQGSLTELQSWGSLALGAVTGANAYFSLSEESAAQFGLVRGRDVIPLCPAGSRHLRRRDLDEDALRALSAKGAPTWLFAPNEELSPEALAYISMGEKMQIDKRYKCRKRSPWWKVPLPPVPDAFITYMNSFGPNICANSVSVPHLNSCHGIRFRDGLKDLGASVLPIAAFNSATLLSAELVGRSYGGGIQKLEPREAAKVMVPSPQIVESIWIQLESIRATFDDCLESGDFETAVSTVDSVVLARGLGMSEGQMKLVQEEFRRVRERRKNRSRGR